MTESGLTVIFRTQSDIEANVVEALLDSHGVETMRTSGPTPGLFPFENSMPAISSAVLSLRAVFSLPPKNPSAASRRLTVGTETPAIAAKSSWDQRSRARAALIWRIDTFRIDFISILMVSTRLGP